MLSGCVAIPTYIPLRRTQSFGSISHHALPIHCFDWLNTPDDGLVVLPVTAAGVAAGGADAGDANSQPIEFHLEI